MRKKITFALLSLLLVPLAMMAQNVTIEPSTGSLVAGVGGANTSDTGKDAGFYSTWRHEQLDLTMTGSDVANLTQAGDLADPNCVFGVINDKHVVANGQTQTFIVVSLPKGYRITGYTIVLQPNLGSTSFSALGYGSSWNNNTIATRFYETEAWEVGDPYGGVKTTGVELTDEQYLARAETSGGDYTMNPNTDGGLDFVISRTSMNDDDMGNRLYFFVSHDGSYYSFTIKSFEIKFTAQGTFDAQASPTEVGVATNYVTSPFTTSKTTYGEVTYNNDYGRYMFDYSNVKDVKAYIHLYEEDAVGNSGLPVVGSGNIHPVEVDGGGHFAFGSSTYYVEPPTTVRTSSSIEGPIGFRIVGAKFKTLWGTATEGQTVKQGQTVKIGQESSGSSSSSNYYITYTSDGTTYYLTSSNSFTTNQDEAQLWTVSGSGNSYTISYTSGYTTYYLRHNNNSVSISNGNNGRTWQRDGNTLYYTSGSWSTTYYYLIVNDGALSISTSSSGTRPTLTQAETSVDYNIDNYLISSLIFGSTEANAADWTIDEYRNLYIGSGEDKQYLACFGEGDTRSLSLSSVATGDMARWNLKRDENGRLYYLSDGGNYYYLYSKSISEGGATNIRGFVIKSSDGTYSTPSGYTAVGSSNPTTGTEITLPDFTPAAYTLKVYDKTGKTVLSNGTITVNSESDAKDGNKWKTYEFNDFNNDAVKFTVDVTKVPAVELDDEGNVVTDEDGNPVYETDEDGNIVYKDAGQALIDVTLELEALNPYIDRMNIFCESAAGTDGKKLELTQTFTADNFAVAGDQFTFYIPTDYAQSELTFTFNDLYSHYGDETYGSNGHARYSFVSSPYFSAFDNVAGNKVAPTRPAETLNWNNDATDTGLYDERYVGSGTSVQPGAAIAKTHKIYASVAGDKAFKFNNAESLTGGGTLFEYPFSVAQYLSTEEGGTGGKFLPIKLKASDSNNKSGEYYLFTADETRYNIAPTTAWQHRSYAFYKMEIELVAKSYTPVLTWTKVYDNTCLSDNGTNVSKEMWGLEMTVQDDGAAVEGGYLSVSEIVNSINGTKKEDGTTYVQPHVGPSINESGAPTSMDQILYIDLSKLDNVVASSGTSLATLKNELAANALVFLPQNTVTNEDNFASKTAAEGIYEAGGNIVLTDKQAFYSPYDIKVASAMKAKYDRQVTKAEYGRTTKQSLILPFDLYINNGQYSGPSTFKVTALSKTPFTYNEEEEALEATFNPVSGTSTKANMPYMVDIANTSDGTFSVEQGGATIKATTAVKKADDYMFFGESVTVADNEGNNHTFYPRGSFSGRIYDEKKEENPDDFHSANVFFYYASNDLFRSSADLNRSKLYAYPFRAFYGYNGPANAAKRLTSFLFSYGGEETDGISENTKRIDFAVQSGKGYLRVTTGKDANIRIYTLNGMKVAAEQMLAGKTSTFALPAGVYVVNGMKIIVK